MRSQCNRKHRSLWNAFNFALAGIKHGIISENNYRIHSLATLILMIFNMVVRPRLELVIVGICTCLIVLAFELINTSIERAVDLITNGQYSEVAKQSKDTAAAAVLLASIGACAIGAYIVISSYPWRFELFSTKHVADLTFSILAVIVTQVWWFTFFTRKNELFSIERRNPK